MATYEKNQLYQVPLAELQTDPTQPRKYMDPPALEEMTASVGQIGIIEPIVCRQDPATNLVYVVAGNKKISREIRGECRLDPTVPKKVLIEIAQKKQERGMVTQFQKYLDQRERAAARQQAETLPSQKRTKAETLADQIGALQNRMGELDFPTLSEGDREMVMESLNSLKNVVEETLVRAVKKAKILA